MYFESARKAVTSCDFFGAKLKMSGDDGNRVT